MGMAQAHSLCMIHFVMNNGHDPPMAEQLTTPYTCSSHDDGPRGVDCSYHVQTNMSVRRDIIRGIRVHSPQ